MLYGYIVIGLLYPNFMNLPTYTRYCKSTIYRNKDILHYIQSACTTGAYISQWNYSSSSECAAFLTRRTVTFCQKFSNISFFLLHKISAENICLCISCVLNLFLQFLILRVLPWIVNNSNMKHTSISSKFIHAAGLIYLCFLSQSLDHKVYQWTHCIFQFHMSHKTHFLVMVIFLKLLYCLAYEISISIAVCTLFFMKYGHISNLY